MLEIIMGLIVVIVGLFLNGCRLSRKAEKLGEENKALEIEKDIALEMEVANKLAEETEQIDLEQVNTDNWREELKK